MIAARQIFLGRGAGAKLPYDAEVEYLETSYQSYSYLNTGYVLRANDVVSGCYQFIRRTSLPGDDYTAVFGARNGNFLSNAFTLFSLFGASPRFTICRTGNETKTSFDSTKKTEFSVSGNALTVTVDGVSETAYSNGSITDCVNNCFIFCLNTAGAGSERTDTPPAQARLWWFKIVSGNLTVRDMIPVRFTNELSQSEGAMYDRRGVGGMNPDGSPRTDGLYRNRGTGAFGYGNDK